MQLLFFFLTLFLTFPSYGEEMVFLVEGAKGKQVGISSDFKNYDYFTKDFNHWHLYPDISADGEWITYVQGENEKSLRLIVENKKLKIKEIWGDKGFLLQPRFSNNSHKVFFSLKTESGNQLAYYDLALLRQKHRPESQGEFSFYNLKPEFSFSTEMVGDIYFPAPFQEGERIVFQKNTSDKKRHIVFYDFLQKKEQILDEGMAPSLSKDERFVAYTKKVENNWDIYIYDLWENKKLKVTSHEASDFSPSFDRFQNLIFTSDRNEKGVFSIFTQSQQSWRLEKEEDVLLIADKGVSFYAPRVSGIKNYTQSLAPSVIGEARSSFGALFHQDKVYVIGGHKGAEHTYPPESFSNDNTIYDIKTKKWSEGAPRPFKAHGFQLAAHGKYIYAFGGFAYHQDSKPKWKSLDQVDRYDTVANKWETVAQMPHRRSSNIVMQIGLKVYLIGGWDSTPKFSGDIDGTFLNQIDVFDLSTETFATLEVLLPKKRRAFSGFVKDQKIYLLGGISEGGSHFDLLNDFTEFDTQTFNFKELPSLPFATFAPTSGHLDHKAFLFGGMIKTGKDSYEYVRHIYQFNFDLNKWTHSGRYLNESKGFSQVVNLDQSLGILGGHSYQNNTDRPVSTFEVFGENGFQHLLP